MLSIIISMIWKVQKTQEMSGIFFCSFFCGSMITQTAWCLSLAALRFIHTPRRCKKKRHCCLCRSCQLLKEQQKIITIEKLSFFLFELLVASAWVYDFEFVWFSLQHSFIWHFLLAVILLGFLSNLLCHRTSRCLSSLSWLCGLECSTVIYV